MGKIIKLSDVRNFADLTEKSGEELLKQLLLCAKDSDETEEYKVFLAAIKSLNDANHTAPESSLRMQVSYDRSKQTIDFTFKFERLENEIRTP